MRNLPLIILYLLSLPPLLISAQKACSNYGSPSSIDPGVCTCPPGFLNSTDCLQPQCGGNLLDAGSGTAPLAVAGGLGNVTAGSCACEDGWTGPICSGELPSAIRGTVPPDLTRPIYRSCDSMHLDAGLHLPLPILRHIQPFLLPPHLDPPEYQTLLLLLRLHLRLIPAPMLGAQSHAPGRFQREERVGDHEDRRSGGWAGREG